MLSVRLEEGSGNLCPQGILKLLYNAIDSGAAEWR
jgi:hypothetical protein